MIISISKLRARLQASDTVVAFWTCGRSTVQISRATQISRKASAQKIESVIHLGSQSIGFCKASETDDPTNGSNMPDVMMKLPAVMARGGVLMGATALTITGDIAIERFIGTFKPSVLEKLLSVYKAAEQDIQALNSIVRSLQGGQQKLASTSAIDMARPRSIRYTISVRSQGICVSLQAAQVLSTLTIQTGAISGNIASIKTSSDLKWNANVTSLLLSLGHQAAREKPSPGIPLKQSASMQFSLNVSQEPEDEVHDDSGAAVINPTTIGVLLANVHATLQVSALTEVYDLLGSWSTDLRAVRTRRKDEWEQVVNKTGQLMKTDSAMHSPDLAEEWFMLKSIINVRLTGLALAIPLTLNLASDSPTAKSAALLFTVAAVEVSNQKGDSGKVEVVDVLLQFVNR